MKKLIVFAMVATVLTIFNGCQKDTDFLEESVTFEDAKSYEFYEGQMIIGDKLRNPYSVENMRKAYNNLQADNTLKSAVKIETTHFYVRFRPKSFQELNALTRDTTLHIYDYPLDVEIKRGGTHYHDPSIPRNEITWQYTVVPVDYTFPDIQYQKLADLFLQEETGELEELKSGKMDYFDWLALETEALRITGNLEDEPTGVELKSTSWRPAGTIKVFDDVINSYSSTIKVFDHYEYYNCETGEIIIDPYGDDGDYPLKSAMPPDDETPICQRAVYRYETSTTNSHFIPMEGVTVRARRWFTTHEGMTDANGNFTCDGTFDGDANYSIKWERWDFDIMELDPFGNKAQAYFNGPKQTGNWNLNIDHPTSKSFLYAHIFRAAFTYYYKYSRWGIKPPPRRDGIFGALNNRLHIGAADYVGRSKYLSFNDFILDFMFTPDIRVFSGSKTATGSVVWKDSQAMFGTTIHELAHASHWEMGYNNFRYIEEAFISRPYLPESWATGVEWVITNDIYQTTNYLDYYQDRTISEIQESAYTPLVIDLIDDENQGHGFGRGIMPNDEAEQYILSQLEGALYLNPTSWWGWRDNIKNEISNPTENHIDYLFQNYKK